MDRPCNIRVAENARIKEGTYKEKYHCKIILTQYARYGLVIPSKINHVSSFLNEDKIKLYQ